MDENSNFYPEFFKWRTGSGAGFKRYHCIFDEKSGCLEITKPHEHIVLQSWVIKGPRGHVANGIAIQTEVGWKWGCMSKNLSEL